MEQKIISALNRRVSDGGIGYQNKLLYPRLPGDMEWFVDLSVGQKGGNVNIMGRKNWDSIPNRFKPFDKGRITIVVSGKEHPGISKLPNCWVVHDPIQALHFAQVCYPDRDIIINGGGEIYKILFPYCHEICSTDVVGDDRPADVFVPEYPNSFKVVSASEIMSHQGIKYQFNVYHNEGLLTA